MRAEVKRDVADCLTSMELYVELGYWDDFLRKHQKAAGMLTGSPHCPLSKQLAKFSSAHVDAMLKDGKRDIAVAVLTHAVDAIGAKSKKDAQYTSRLREKLTEIQA